MIVLNSAEIAITMGEKGHKERECRSKKRDEANRQAQDKRQEQPQRERPKNNSKLVCNSCGFTGHSVGDYRHKAKGASALRNVPHDEKDTNENRRFRNEFKSSHRKAPLNEVTGQPEFYNSSDSEEDQALN